jgi:hypothetical protein
MSETNDASVQSVVMTRFAGEQKREFYAAVTTAISICRTGFANRSSLGFPRIKEILRPYEEVNAIKQAIALCGADTISTRFAYPHIESLLLDLLAMTDSSS